MLTLASPVGQVNPYPHLQKNLLIWFRRGPRRPQQLYGVSQKISKVEDNFGMLNF